MIIELSFQNGAKKERKVQILIEYISIEEMMEKSPKLLKVIIEGEKIKSEHLVKIEKLDI